MLELFEIGIIIIFVILIVISFANIFSKDLNGK